MDDQGYISLGDDRRPSIAGYEEQRLYLYHDRGSGEPPLAEAFFRAKRARLITVGMYVDEGIGIDRVPGGFLFGFNNPLDADEYMVSQFCGKVYKASVNLSGNPPAYIEAWAQAVRDVALECGVPIDVRVDEHSPCVDVRLDTLSDREEFMRLVDNKLFDYKAFAALRRQEPDSGAGLSSL
jgi:hypothetical protein